MLLFKIKYRLFISAILLFQFSQAQVRINNSIEFTGDSTQNRQVENHIYPSDPSSAVNVEASVAGYLKYYTVVGINADTIELSFPLQVNSYANGMRIHFVATAYNLGNTYIKITGLSPVKIVKQQIATLPDSSLRTGQITALQFDGTNFQLLNPVLKQCPAGYAEVNEKYCIQVNESVATSDFYVAFNNCLDNGARLCTWGEWYYACTQSGTLGLTNMTNNFEWIGTAGNSAGQAAIAGNANCEASGVGNATGSTLRKSRCCYSK